MTLIYVSAQFSAEVVLTALFIFNDVAGRAQFRNTCTQERLIVYCISSFRTALFQVEFLNSFKNISVYSITVTDYFPFESLFNRFLIIAGKRSHLSNLCITIIHFVPKLLFQVKNTYIEQREFFFKHLFTDGISTHHQNQPKKRISVASGIISNYIRNRFGICFKNRSVIRHIML